MRARIGTNALIWRQFDDSTILGVQTVLPTYTIYIGSSSNLESRITHHCVIPKRISRFALCLRLEIQWDQLASNAVALDLHHFLLCWYGLFISSFDYDRAYLGFSIFGSFPHQHRKAFPTDLPLLALDRSCCNCGSSITGSSTLIYIASTSTCSHGI